MIQMGELGPGDAEKFRANRIYHRLGNRKDYIEVR